MNKKVYFLLIFVFASSALLLGLSYSKDSGNDASYVVNESYDHNFRVVYSTSDKLNKNNKSVDLGITNITKENKEYVIKLIKNNDKKVYYTLDGEEEQTLGKEVIFTSSLKPYGTDGDYVLHRLSVKGDEGFNVSVAVTLVDRSLKTYIIDDNQVFKDKQNNYRFYGEDPNNYIKIDNQVYRMIGLIGNRIRLISDVSNRPVMYNKDKKYLSINDYVLSFDKHDLNEKNTFGNKSWLDIDYRYWLETDNDQQAKMVDADVGVRTDYKSRIHYERVIREVENKYNVVSGDGSLTTPYEVSYGS